MTLTKWARVTSLLFTGLFAGFLTAVLVLELSLRGFDGSVYAQMRLVELDSLDKLAAATLLPALSITALLAYRTRRTNKRRPTLAALALLVLVVGLTIAVNLPINADQLHWNTAAPPADWADVRDRWQLAHATRTTAAVLAFALLATAWGSAEAEQRGQEQDHSPEPEGVDR
uniref:anthrone oxygenase family protein n=1 Tax=Paractinoplanes polyasparticus TaxID=2856853 RepID=UPI0021026F15|nr:anthrone oxygenase family protein [Actinoplanes polyasparticus]